ncbi:4Fe-4S binding protein [Candidatus Woesearchaeota archaeon]|nr:4Fe-4S binding protein [Candidatus Woesearchaeota archaeon]
MTKDLKVNFLGTELINPFVLASAPPTKDYETIKKAFEAGWAGAVTKSVVSSPLKDKQPRIGHIKYKGKVLASQNYEMGSVYTPEQWADWAVKLTKEFPDRMLYASIFADANPDGWKYLAEYFLGTGIQGLELNFSCPHSDHNGKGSIIGQNPDLCASLTEAVKKTVGEELKIMPKLTYLSHPNEGLVSRMCIEAGADAIAGINTIAGLCEINPYNLKPRLNTGGKTTAGGLSYHMIRPFGRLVISRVADAIDWKKHPISAMGGVSKDIGSIVDYLSLGANHLQVCTEVMNNGFNVIDEMKKNLLDYLNETGRTLDNLRGKALPYVTVWNNLDETDRVARISWDDCVLCEECISYCQYDAIQYNKEDLSINENCNGCGSCYSVCPTNAITMVKKD